MGGTGGAGSDPAGAAGEGYDTPTTGQINSNAGGGGGGAGIVRINFFTTFTGSGLVSPAAGTAAYSEGRPPSY